MKNNSVTTIDFSGGPMSGVATVDPPLDPVGLRRLAHDFAAGWRDLPIEQWPGSTALCNVSLIGEHQP